MCEVPRTPLGPQAAPTAPCPWLSATSPYPRAWRLRWAWQRHRYRCPFPRRGCGRRLLVVVDHEGGCSMSTITTHAGRAVKAREGTAGTTVAADRPPDARTPSAGRGGAARHPPDAVGARRPGPRGLPRPRAPPAAGTGMPRGRPRRPTRPRWPPPSSSPINFVTVDYTKVDADIAPRQGRRHRASSSRATRPRSNDLKKVLVANKTVSTVQRTEAALVSGDRDSAVALVGVVAPDQEHRRPQRRDQDLPDAAASCAWSAQAWKVENLEFVG